MSTKTNFKRIALVAVTALGLGVLSSVPSSAAIIGVPTVTTTNGTATLQNSDSTTAATIAVKFNATAAGDSVTITVSLGSKPSGAVGATDSILATASDTSTSTGGAPLLSISGLSGITASWAGDSITATTQTVKSAGAGVTNAKFKYHLDTGLVRTAGTYTLDYYTTVYSGGAAVTASAAFGQATIVVTDGTAAVATNVTASGTSTALMSSGTTWSTVTVDDAVTGVFTPSTVVGVIQIKQLGADGLPARESVTVSTNIGNLGWNTNVAGGKSLSNRLASASGVDYLYIIADGSSGTATINIKTTSATFASKSVTFYSTSVDKYTVTRLAKVIGSASAATLIVTALDSTGNIIKESTNSTVYAYSDNLSAIATAATAADGAACSAYNATLGGHVCSFSGAANGVANITIRNKSTLALSTKSSTAQAITVNLNPAVKIALSFDKASYAPGELAYLSLSAVDAAGAAVGPNAGTAYLTSAGITGSAAFGNGSAGSESLTVTATPMNVSATGRVTDVALYTVKLYMPASGGTITASATGGTALTAANQVKVTATATVSDSGAAALAAVTALATTVASLKTLITTLTNLVLKIQKKVKA